MGDSNDPFMRNPNAAIQARPKVQLRANVLQLKMIGQSHPTGLTNNLLKLFEARPPLEFKPPPEKKICPPYTGMAQFVKHFAEPGDAEYSPPVIEAETRAQKKARIHQLRLEKGVKKVMEDLEKYDPQNDPNVTGDPYKTLFVSRLSYETSESRLTREFETYGPIKRVGIHNHPVRGWLLCSNFESVQMVRAKTQVFKKHRGYGTEFFDMVRMIYDKETNKPKGYAFIEYAHTRDMKAAYKQADGRKIDGRRVLVDVERGRTVPNWRPRRLGGGLGTTRVGGEDANPRHSTMELQSGVSRSEEPRIREDRDREKSRDRGRERDRDREKSRERSHDKSRDRDRDERRRDRDRDHDRDRRDRDRGKDRGRDYDREKSHDRSRDKDKEHRGVSRDRDYDYDHERGRHGEKKRGYEDPEAEYDDDHYGHHQTRGHYDDPDNDRYNQYDDDNRGQYDQMDEDN